MVSMLGGSHAWPAPSCVELPLCGCDDGVCVPGSVLTCVLLAATFLPYRATGITIKMPWQVS